MVDQFKEGKSILFANLIFFNERRNFVPYFFEVTPRFWSAIGPQARHPFIVIAERHGCVDSRFAPADEIETFAKERKELHSFDLTLGTRHRMSRIPAFLPRRSDGCVEESTEIRGGFEQFSDLLFRVWDSRFRA